MSEIIKISIALTGPQIAFLRSAVSRGEYATTSEAVREALRDWHYKRGLRKANHPKTRRKAAKPRRVSRKTHRIKRRRR